MTQEPQVGAALFAERKRALRVAMRERRKGRAADELEQASARAQARLADSPLAAAAGLVALYQPFPAEVSTVWLGLQLSARGKRVCYPVVRDDARALAFREPGDGAFRLGALGTQEPRGPAVDLSLIDLFVVPAVAVDLRGGRLGRGRGHYDATLDAAGPRASRVALVFDWQIADEVPAEGHDQPLDAICSEARWVQISREGRSP